MGQFAIANERIVTVFGGSGFLGRYVVRALAQRGWRIRVASRRPDLAFHLQPLGRVGQIHAVQANLRYPASIKGAMRGSEAVVNLVGILSELGAAELRSRACLRFEGGRQRGAGAGHRPLRAGLGDRCQSRQRVGLRADQRARRSGGSRGHTGRHDREAVDPVRP